MSQAVAFPSWTPHPDVWLLIGLLAAGYYIAVVRLGPRLASPGQTIVTRFQITCWSLGVFAVWLASDWPIDDVGEHFNFSVHMIQHLVYILVVAPLLILGMPAWLMRWLLQNRRVFGTVRWLARFVPALVVYSAALVFTHWPTIMDASLRSEPVHFSMHAVMLLSGILVWLPVVSPLPEIPRLQPVVRMIYLFAWSIAPLMVATVLIFSSKPVYTFYAKVPHLYGVSTTQDQQIGGVLMQVGGGLLLWMLIAVVFFRWAADEEASSTPRQGLASLDREFTEMTRTSSERTGTKSVGEET